MADYSPAEIQAAVNALKQGQPTSAAMSTAPTATPTMEFRSTQSPYTQQEIDAAVKALHQKSAEVSGETPKTINGRPEDIIDRFIQAGSNIDAKLSGRPAPDISNDPTYEFSRRLGLGALGAGVSTVGGASPLVSLLNGYFTQTPADLGTGLALGPLLGGADKLKFASRPANALFGAAKGLGAYEGGQRLNAFMSGQPQPSLDPLERLNQNPLELPFAGMAAGAGAMSGTHQIPTGIDPYETQRDAYNKWKMQTRAAKDDFNQTKTAITDHKEDMNMRAQEAYGAARKQFQQQKGQLAQVTDDLDKQKQTAKANLDTAAQNLQDHQDHLVAKQTGQAQDTAESIQDQILRYQERLREIKMGPPTSEASDSSETTPLAGKIQAMQKDMDRRETLDLQNKIASLKVQQRRMNQGRFDIVPTDEDLEDYQKLQALQANHATAAQELQTLNDKYNQATSAQLMHANTAPGRMGPDAADVTKMVDLRNKRDIAQAAYNNQLKNKPTVPGKVAGSAGDIMTSALKMVGPVAVSSLIGHEFGMPGWVGPAITAGIGGAQKLINTQGGQKVASIAEQQLGKNANRIIPAIVNASKQ